MKILIATDGTRHSQAALETVSGFRLDAGDEIYIVSVVDMAVPMAVDMYGGYLPQTSEIEKSVREAAETILQNSEISVKSILKNDEIKITTEILYGSPDSRIVETAEAFGANLIIVGSHGYNRWERLLLGSVSDSVIHHAHCSVMVVRTAKE